MSLLQAIRFASCKKTKNIFCLSGKKPPKELQVLVMTCLEKSSAADSAADLWRVVPGGQHHS